METFQGKTVQPQGNVSTDAPVPPLITGLSGQRSLAELAAASAQAKERTPVVVLDALEPSPSSIAGIALPDMISLSTWMRLEKIGSPFAGPMGEDTVITLEDILAAFYIIAAPSDQVRKAIRAGDDAFNDAVEDFASALPVAQMTEVGTGLSAYISAQFATAAKMAPPDGGDEKGGDSPLASTSGPAATGPEASPP